MAVSRSQIKSRAKKTAKRSKVVVKKVKAKTAKSKAKPKAKTTSKAKAILAQAAKAEKLRKAKQAAKAKAEAAKLQQLLKESRAEARAAKRAEKAAEKAAAAAAEKASRQVTRVLGPKTGLTKLKAFAKKSSVGELAELMRTTPATVKRWLAKGPSKLGLAAITRLALDRKAMAAEGKIKKQNFELCLKQSAELGILPRHPTRERVRSGRNTYGREYVKGWHTGLTAQLIDEIVAWVGSKPRNPDWKYYQAVATVSQYGTAKTHGYKTIDVQLPNEVSGEFILESVLSTHRSTKRVEVTSELRELLEDMLETGTLTFVHSSTLFNYRWRTEEQARMLDTMHRRERKKQWQSQQKRQLKQESKPKK